MFSQDMDFALDCADQWRESVPGVEEHCCADFATFLTSQARAFGADYMFLVTQQYHGKSPSR